MTLFYPSIIRYNKALAFRREQLPEMDTRADTDVIVFNDRTFEDHIIDFDAILIFFYGSAVVPQKKFHPKVRNHGKGP